MKVIKNLIWVMVLIWLSTAAFNSVWDLYSEGGIWKIVTWVFVAILLAIYCFTVGRAIKIISHKEKDNVSNQPLR